MRKTKLDNARGRANEEAYFRSKDAELIQDLKVKEAAHKERADMKQAAGIDDDHLVAELKACGYDRETVRVLHLAPLLQVAWADGKISKEERLDILEAARLHGVEPDSRAHRRLESWLEHRPSDSVFRRSLRAVRAVLHAMEPEQKHARKLGLLSLCTKVAAASGGFFGLGSKISAAERAMLAEIASEVEHAHGGAAKLVAARIQEK
jgi:tellurite resistance protein